MQKLNDSDKDILVIGNIFNYCKNLTYSVWIWSKVTHTDVIKARPQKFEPKSLVIYKPLHRHLTGILLVV